MRRYVAPSLATPLLLGCLSTITTAVQFEGFDQYTPYVPNDDPELKLEQLWTFEYNDKPTMLRFVPGSDAVITVGKTGVLCWYNSIDADKDKFTVMLDMSADVHSNADHGVQSLEFHPDWDLGVHTAFVLYTGEPKSVKTLPNEAAIESMRPDGWGDDNGGYKWWDQCPCLDCEGTGQNENGLLCEHPYYIDRITIDVKKGKAKKDITLLQAACGASSSHGPGHLLRVGDDILFGVGDGSQFTIIDTGLPEDGCFDPDKGKGQGSLRAIRDDFNNGKIRRLPYNLMDSPKELEGDQVPVIAKGVRQPFRMFYHDKQDVLYIGDVGFGDTGTSERIFTMEGLGDPKKAPALPVSNFGWPCVEGVREYILGGFKIYDGPFERDLQKWYDAEGVDYCDSTMLAASAYVEQREASEDADPDWKAPVFEYRVGVMDKDYEDVCVSEFAALASVHFYKGANMPAQYADKLMFSDYAKQCVWYFENKDGKPDTTKLPKTLLVGTGFVHLETGPDGALYGTDFVNGRIIRMSKIGGALATPAPTATPTKPTKAPTAAPTQPVPVDAAVTCFNPGAMPEFEWHQNGDGTYEGTLTLGAVELHTSKGFMRTFAYNGMLPGPIMRMKTCGKYTLNVINDLARWPAPEGGMINTLHDPTVTNLHLHGLHVSGMAPGDDVSIMIEPGQTNKYTYTLPCDHSSGTNWYHPHNHGSSALQTTGGAYGLLVIESSARELADMPAAYAALPAQHLVFQDFNPPDTASFSAQSGDGVFATDIDGPLILVNGCEQVELVVEEGQWTRLNMLNSGHIYNSLVEIEVAKQDAEDCTIGLLQKDGAWLAQVPRMLEKKRANKLFFSLASRVDAVIMCPTAGVPHTITYSHIVDPTWEGPVTVGTIRVVPSLRPAAKALPMWEPCRPAYLMDLNAMPDKKLGNSFALEVRTQLNGQLFTGPEDYLATMTVNKPQQWLVIGTDQHPLHIHVNHMQLGDITKANQWDEAPGWHVTGDFIDTLSAKAQVPVRVNPERFIGPMFLHCHVPSHADLGVLGVIDILGKGDDGEASPEVEDYGSCTKDIPNSKPYGEKAIRIPGIVQAEEFDKGGAGVAFYNINGAPLSAPPIRDDEPVEIMPVQHGGVAGYGVTGIRAGEWLRYTVDVQRKGHYNVFFVQASKDLLQGVSMRLYKDAKECPKPSETKNLLARIKDTTYTGTGDIHDFVSLASNRRAKFDSTGKHKLLLCFDAGAFPRGMVLDALTLRYCGKTAKECKALEPKPPAPTPTPAPTAAPTAAEVGGPTVSPTAAPTAAADTAAALLAESAGSGENAAAAAPWFGPAVTASLALIAGLVL